MAIYDSLCRKMFTPIDAASIAVFRIGLGFILFVEALRYLFVLCTPCFYLETDFLFKYAGFEWVVPWSAWGLYLHWAVLGIAAICIMLGLFYRVATVVFLLGFAYLFLLDQARYLNHFYMVMLFCALLCFIPAHRYWSLDARRRPELASATLPAWCRWVLCIQLEIILIYAGLVKLNPDWLNLAPLKMWLAYRSDMPLVGWLFTQDWSVAVAAYGVVVLHLLGAPLLLVPRVRLVVLGIYACFHILNHFVFNIGIFPWMTLFASLLCFDPSWPRQFYAWITRKNPGRRAAWMMAAPPEPAGSGSAGALISRMTAYHHGVILLAGLWVVLQVLIPLRHWAYPGNVAWNEEGHRFSWRMKLRDKRGVGYFVITDPQSGKRWLARPEKYLNAKQSRKMLCIPDMILQFSHFLADTWKVEKGIANPQVNAKIRCRLNGRPSVPFVDPEVNLAEVSRSLGHQDWILPLDTPLPEPFLKDRSGEPLFSSR